MSLLHIVVDKVTDWKPFYPSDNVIGFEEYLRKDEEPGRVRIRVINLCRAGKYLSRGYYCSLLAEARGHTVIPNVETLNNLRRRQLYTFQFEDLENRIASAAAKSVTVDHGEFSVMSYFGRVEDPALRTLARELFERFPCPILQIRFRKVKQWEIAGLNPLAPSRLNDAQQTLFADMLQQYSHQVWRKPKQRRRYHYDLAILVDPDEKMPPSDPAALRRFVRAGRQQGMSVDLIRRRDFTRIEEYDALFIRATTAINDYTYHFARKAAAEGIVVIDDPTSILRCTNKVYLADLLRKHKIPAPATQLLMRGDAPERIREQLDILGFPLVLKVPDGSFSRGVVRVADESEMKVALQSLFPQTGILLAQEYLYTKYDWRIGVLAGKAIYACKYLMVRHHWQIYRHDKNQTDTGGFETVPIDAAPPAVVAVALKACRLIGDGLYGVDVKQSGDRVAVIEVNDNPSIDAGVEDKCVGKELYRMIVSDIVRRIESSRPQTK